MAASPSCTSPQLTHQLYSPIYSCETDDFAFIGHGIDCWLYPIDKALKSKMICKTPIGIFVEDLHSWKSISVEEGHPIFHHGTYDEEATVVFDESILHTTKTYLQKYFNDIKIWKEIREINEDGRKNIIYKRIEKDIYKIMKSATFLWYRNTITDWCFLPQCTTGQMHTILCVFLEMNRENRLKFVSDNFEQRINFVGRTLMFYESNEMICTGGVLSRKCSLYDASPTVKLLHAGGLTKDTYKYLPRKPTKSQISKFLAFEFDDATTAQCFLDNMYNYGTTASLLYLKDVPLTLRNSKKNQTVWSLNQTIVNQRFKDVKLAC